VNERWYFPVESGIPPTHDPESLPGFSHWRILKTDENHRILKKGPIVYVLGTEYMGLPGRATQKDAIPCTDSCKRAIHPYCMCSCGGKNHGIAHMLPHELTPEQDEALKELS